MTMTWVRQVRILVAPEKIMSPTVIKLHTTKGQFPIDSVSSGD